MVRSMKNINIVRVLAYSVFIITFAYFNLINLASVLELIPICLTLSCLYLYNSLGDAVVVLWSVIFTISNISRYAMYYYLKSSYGEELLYTTLYNGLFLVDIATFMIWFILMEVIGSFVVQTELKKAESIKEIYNNKKIKLGTSLASYSTLSIVLSITITTMMFGIDFSLVLWTFILCVVIGVSIQINIGHYRKSRIKELQTEQDKKEEKEIKDELEALERIDKAFERVHKR